MIYTVDLPSDELRYASIMALGKLLVEFDVLSEYRIHFSYSGSGDPRWAHIEWRVND